MPGRLVATNIRVLLRAADEGDVATDADRALILAQRRAARLWRPPTDIFETAESVVVVVEAAGMKEAEFSVTLDRQDLTVSGSRAGMAGPRAYHRMEIGYGEFVTEVTLPVAVEPSGMEADYSDGFLKVVLPKAKARRVSVSG
jgi:HSP20 family protein